jgi:hypothetical protein
MKESVLKRSLVIKTDSLVVLFRGDEEMTVKSRDAGIMNHN